MENLNFVLENSWKTHQIYFCDLRGNPVIGPVRCRVEEKPVCGLPSVPLTLLGQ